MRLSHFSDVLSRADATNPVFLDCSMLAFQPIRAVLDSSDTAASVVRIETVSTGGVSALSAMLMPRAGGTITDDETPVLETTAGDLRRQLEALGAHPDTPVVYDDGEGGIVAATIEQIGSGVATAFRVEADLVPEIDRVIAARTGRRL